MQYPRLADSENSDHALLGAYATSLRPARPARAATVSCIRRSAGQAP